MLPLLAILLTSDPAQARDTQSNPTSTPKPFFLTIHIATTIPKDSDQLITEYIHTANKHFAAAGISFIESARNILPKSFAILETQQERHRLKKYFVPNTINIFLLDEIDDPTPSDSTKKAAGWQGLSLTGLLAGAHIEYKGQKPGTYIILSRNSSNLILTHELGHFFGAGHAKNPTNIMSYGSDRLRFDETQQRTFQSVAKRFRKQHILKY